MTREYVEQILRLPFRDPLPRTPREEQLAESFRYWGRYTSIDELDPPYFEMMSSYHAYLDEVGYSQELDLTLEDIAKLNKRLTQPTYSTEGKYDKIIPYNQAGNVIRGWRNVGLELEQHLVSGT